MLYLVSLIVKLYKNVLEASYLINDGMVITTYRLSYKYVEQKASIKNTISFNGQGMKPSSGIYRRVGLLGSN